MTYNIYRRGRYGLAFGGVMKKLKIFWWNVKNIIRWLPVLWGNYDWDMEYLNRIVSFKLDCMIKDLPNWKIENARMYRAGLLATKARLDIAIDIDALDEELYNEKQKFISDAYKAIADHQEWGW